MKKSIFATLSLLVFASVANGTPLDLTTAGANGYINEAYFLQVPDQTTGTGVIEPFLRIQANETEQGYNTSNNSPAFNEKKGIWTHDLLLSAVPIKSIGEINYYEFLLDINQNKGGNSELLSLDQLKIYQGSVTSPNTTDIGSLGYKAYDLDANGDSWIKLNYMLNPGSGAGDMFAYIPTALFTDPGQYLYLYSQFGTNFGSNDGFEEWAVIGQSAPPVPEPGTMMLLGVGMFGLAIFGKRRMNK